jgi:hypothetical protein
MYEPYGESKKFDFKIDKEKLRELKDKFVENIKKIRYNKWAMVLIAIGFLVVLGGYTGYVTYTGKIDEMNSHIVILERQLEACQENVTVCLIDLDNTENQLSTCQDDKEDCESDLKKARSDLSDCNDEKDTLSTTLTVLEETLSESEIEYEDLKDDYEDLEDDYEEMECRYASNACGKIGMNYYFMKDTQVVCCLKKDSDYCTEKPGDEDIIQEINC